jgi:hypothetical protein
MTGYSDGRNWDAGSGLEILMGDIVALSLFVTWTEF